MRFFILAVSAFLISAIVTPAHAQTVYDHAALFSKEDADWIEQFHGKLLEEYDIDYRVVTTTEASEVSVLAYKAFKDLNVGSKSKAGRGLLLVIDPAQDQVRLEVSASLEAVYTDQFVSYIQTRQMIPFFAANRVSDGVLATSELVFRRAREAVDGQEFMPPSEAFSSGGGAQRSAHIDKGKEALPAYNSRKVPVQNGVLTPLQVVDLYNISMRNRDADFMKSIYTRASQAMMQNMVVTPAQMDSAVKAYKQCGQGDVYIIEDIAVVKYDVQKRQCFPYFLSREADGLWKIDFVTMSNRIRFNHNNFWHFVPRTPPSPYAYAFAGYVFDKNGYPHNYTQAWLDTFRWKISYYTMPSGKTYVTWVGEKSPAAKMGFKFGDELISWQGNKQIENQKNAIVLMNKSKPGEKIRAKIKRNEKTTFLESTAPEYKKR